LSFIGHMMRKTFYLLVPALLLMASAMQLSSCGDKDEEFLFEVNYAYNIDVPRGQNPSLSIVFPFTNLESDVALELDRRGISMDDVTTINTTRARLDLIDFNSDFSNFEEVVVNTYLGIDPTANPFEAAYTIEIRERYQDQLDLVPSLTNLKEVMVSDRFSMELQLRPRRVILESMEVRFSISFGVVL